MSVLDFEKSVYESTISDLEFEIKQLNEQNYQLTKKADDPAIDIKVGEPCIEYSLGKPGKRFLVQDITIVVNGKEITKRVCNLTEDSVFKLFLGDKK